MPEDLDKVAWKPELSLKIVIKLLDVPDTVKVLTVWVTKLCSTRVCGGLSTLISLKVFWP